MQDQRIWNIIHRYLSGEYTPDEEQRLYTWLAEDPAHQEFFNAIKKVWQVRPAYNVEADFDEDWKRFSERLGIDLEETVATTKESQRQRQNVGTYRRSEDHPVKQLLRVAAILLIIAIPSYYLISSGTESLISGTETEIAMQNIQTSRGERASMEFSDGSKVMLNSMSTLRFPKAFQGSKRELYLEGEAFFQVARNEDLPFIVYANGTEVTVLGTEFNVNSYRENEAVEVVVREGTVAVNPDGLHGNSKKQQDQIKESDQDNDGVIVTKGQRTTVKPGDRPTSPENVLLAPHLAWVNGEMIFEGTPMHKVVQRLRRAYNLHFEVADSTLLSKRLKASFKRERLDKVLEIISFSLDIRYEMRGDTVVFKSN